MALLDERLRARLPPLHSQEGADEPLVYACFKIGARAWYVIEGEPKGGDFLFFGFLAPADEFREFRLSELEAIRGLLGSRVERDEMFTEARLTDVIPAPES
jgi:hypothetical protein